jgi:hypothetical protein
MSAAHLASGRSSLCRRCSEISSRSGQIKIAVGLDEQLQFVIKHQSCRVHELTEALFPELGTVGSQCAGKSGAADAVVSR